MRKSIHISYNIPSSFFLFQYQNFTDIAIFLTFCVLSPKLIYVAFTDGQTETPRKKQGIRYHTGFPVLNFMHK